MVDPLEDNADVLCFYSKLVRLKAEPAPLPNLPVDPFLFQTGAIKSTRTRRWGDWNNWSFYSKLVRLKAIK